MDAKEMVEHARLQRRWACQRATQKEITRCMELDRRAAVEHQAAQAQAQGRYPTLVDRVCAIAKKWAC